MLHGEDRRYSRVLILPLLAIFYICSNGGGGGRIGRRYGKYTSVTCILCAYMQNSSKSSKYLAYIYSREHDDKSIHMKISTDSLIWVLS